MFIVKYINRETKMVYRYISDLVCVRYNSVCITCSRRVSLVLNVWFIFVIRTDEAKPGITVILIVLFGLDFGLVNLKPV